MQFFLKVVDVLDESAELRDKWSFFFVTGQRIVTIQLDGTQYYVSKMNPYASELNYFLAYQYCRSIGLQLVSFETKEKADSIAEYLKNAGTYNYRYYELFITNVEKRIQGMCKRCVIINDIIMRVMTGHGCI